MRSLAGVAVAALLVAGCGEDDFANEPRTPVRVELTGVIQEDKVTISPAKVGAGPILITISNQTERARTITGYSWPRLMKVDTSRSPNISSRVRPISSTEIPRSAARERSIWTRRSGWDSL